MNVLALDTAGPSPSVALLAGERFAEATLPSDRRASEALLPAIGRVLDACGLRLEDVTRIAVCAGPGSFTGLRVGLATAWGFGRALGIPVEAVSTLEAMAEAARSEGVSRVVTALDAGRGEIICEAFALDGPRARSLAPANRRAPSQLVALYSEGLRVALPAGLVGPAGVAPRQTIAEALARAVARAPGTDGAPPTAIYSRPSAAEEKRGAP
jgi:tRNA threonylcarbamoyladenosine biosynthesis protein TsaB